MYNRIIFWFALVFNVIDALATWFSVCFLRMAKELNPLMAAAIELHPLFFILFKIVIGSLAIWFMYRHSYTKSGAKIGLYVTVFVYTIVVIVHALNFGLYLGTTLL